jgi:transcriptional regulator with XRE-family HTH domain
MQLRICNAAMTVNKILEALERQGLTQTQIASRLRVSQPTVSRWVQGAEPKTRHRDKLLQLAKARGILHADETIEHETVPVIGYVGPGATITFIAKHEPFEEAAMAPGGGGKHTVAVVVQGDGMAPAIEDGWTIYYDDRRDPPTDDLLNKPCVVGLRDGRVLIKKLLRGRAPGRYDLASAGGSVMADQDIIWAARVTFIAPK